MSVPQFRADLESRSLEAIVKGAHACGIDAPTEFHLLRLLHWVFADGVAFGLRTATDLNMQRTGAPLPLDAT